MWIHPTLLTIVSCSTLISGAVEQWTVQSIPIKLTNNQTVLIPKHIILVIPLSGSTSVILKKLTVELQQTSPPVNTIRSVNNHTKLGGVCSYDVIAGSCGAATSPSRPIGQLSLWGHGVRGSIQFPSCPDFPEGFELRLEPSTHVIPNEANQSFPYSHFHVPHNITLLSNENTNQQQIIGNNHHSSTTAITRPMDGSSTVYRNLTSFWSTQQLADTHALRQTGRRNMSVVDLTRYKRSPTSESRNPVLSVPMRILHRPNKPPPYVLELHLIVDQILVNSFRDVYGGSIRYGELFSYVYSLMAKVNTIFAPFNINVVIVNLELWELDRVDLEVEEHHILSKLAQFKSQFTPIRSDCLHALLGAKASRARGSAIRRSMCIFSKCVGYTQVRSTTEIDLVARTVAHELGHNFGLPHDTEDCACQNCLMATGAEAVQYKLVWSPCSLRDMPTLLEYGMGLCLHDTPRHISTRSVYNSSLMVSTPLIPVRTIEAVRSRGLVRRNFCGDGILDPGEECDCGTLDSCPVELRDCCDVTRCRLRSGSACAGGPCCQVERINSSNSTAPHYQCKLAPSGTVCRAESGTCDLPEYCDGITQWCPTDVYKADGIDCRTIEGTWAYCVRGGCRESNSWCRVLWGNSAQMADESCFEWNRIAIGRPRQPFCDLARFINGIRSDDVKNWHGTACPSWRDPECGRLWCEHRNEKAMLLGWVDSKHLHPPHVYESCSALVYDPVWPPKFGDSHQGAGYNLASAVTQDAGLVPDGTPCSKGMCYNGTCMRLRDFVNAKPKCNCGNRAVCNNLAHCHCMRGFHPPHCDLGGNGGSIDSGPPPPPSFPLSNSELLAVCLIIVMLSLGVIIAYLVNKHRRNCLHWSADPIIPTKTGFRPPFDQSCLPFLWEFCQNPSRYPDFHIGSKVTKPVVQQTNCSSNKLSTQFTSNVCLPNGSALTANSSFKPHSNFLATSHHRFSLGFMKQRWRNRRAVNLHILTTPDTSHNSPKVVVQEPRMNSERPAQIDDRLATLRTELESLLTSKFGSNGDACDVQSDKDQIIVGSLPPPFPKLPRAHGNRETTVLQAPDQATIVSPPHLVTMSYTGSICSLDKARVRLKQRRKNKRHTDRRVNGNCTSKMKGSHFYRRQFHTNPLAFLSHLVRRRSILPSHSKITQPVRRLSPADISKPCLQFSSSELSSSYLPIII